MLDKIEVFTQNSIRIKSDVGTIYVDPFKIKDEPHDEDGSSIWDLDALLTHRVSLHDLTAAGARGDVAIEGTDHRGA